MARSQYTRAQVLELGMLALKRYPEVCSELLTEIDEFNSPGFDTDLDNMKKYFSVFSIRNGLLDELMLTKKWSRERTQSIKVFTAAMIRIYRPFRLSYSCKYLMPGFAKQLSEILQLQRPNISQLVREVGVLEKAYDEFRYEVDYTEHYLSIAKEDF